MTDDDLRLRDAVREAWPETHATEAFATVWQRAEASHAGERSRWPQAAGLAAAIVLAAIAIGFIDRDRTAADPAIVDPAELLGSTSWSAPSDALLPRHRVDIYQELPALIEST